MTIMGWNLILECPFSSWNIDSRLRTVLPESILKSRHKRRSTLGLTVDRTPVYVPMYTPGGTPTVARYERKLKSCKYLCSRLALHRPFHGSDIRYHGCWLRPWLTILSDTGTYWCPLRASRCGSYLIPGIMALWENENCEIARSHLKP